MSNIWHICEFKCAVALSSQCHSVSRSLKNKQEGEKLFDLEIGKGKENEKHVPDPPGKKDENEARAWWKWLLNFKDSFLAFALVQVPTISYLDRSIRILPTSFPAFQFIGAPFICQIDL